MTEKNKRLGYQKYCDTIAYFAQEALQKVVVLKQKPFALAIGALMAGAYVGLGIILILNIGTTLDPSIQKLLMGLTFGIALTLVVFAGSELFTGYTMYMTIGWMKKLITSKEAIKILLWVWIFNFIGALVLAGLYSLSQADVPESVNHLLFSIAEKKMHTPWLGLIVKAALCNWLVCLALWMCARTTNDAAKCIFIFWCLLGFIASGYEHSVANMTLLSLALFSEHPETLSILGMAHNLFWVTLGNLIGGVVFMGMGYWHAAYEIKPIQENASTLKPNSSDKIKTLKRTYSTHL